MIAPRGLAFDPETSHVYVADLGNARVDEYTPWGEFVKAFGWNVAPAGVDEEQELRIRATSGSYRLGFKGSTTADLQFDANAEEVEAAIAALSSTGADAVEVEGGPGGIPDVTPAVFIMRFKGGGLEESDVPQVLPSNGSVPLAGSSATLLEVRTRADGTVPGNNLESCTAASGCQAGLSGAGPGQFTFVGSLAVDGSGSIYTFDVGNLRMQKFDSAGRFQLMIGGAVNQSSGEDICTQTAVEAGDSCGAGSIGIGPREFSMEPSSGTSKDYVDIATDGTVFIADRNRFQVVTQEGVFVKELSFADVHGVDPQFPETGEPGSLALDRDDNLYFAFAQGDTATEKVPNVFKLTTDGLLQLTFGVDSPEAVAADSAGNVYIAEIPDVPVGSLPPKVLVLDPTGAPVLPYDEGLGVAGGAEITGVLVNEIGNVLLSVSNPPSQVGQVDAYGPAPLELSPPPLVPPTIEDQYALAVGSSSATVQALVNPHFWADTTLHFEFGDAPCSGGGCSQTPDMAVTTDIVDKPLVTTPIALPNLKEGTTYYFRVVAASSGGGPVTGVEGQFRTQSIAEPSLCKENAIPRRSPSQHLPDCRAYELVSPVDKNGGDLVALCQASCLPAALNQSAVDGSRLTYSTYNSFGDAEAAPYSVQYLGTRSAQGWLTDSITPAQKGPSGLDILYRAFSSDLSFGWIRRSNQPALAPNSEAPNIYRRDNETGTYLPYVSRAMADAGELQGVTPDGRCIIFRAEDKLTPEAMSDLTQLYESCEGEVSLISVLPDGSTSSKASSAGTPAAFANGREASVFNAISNDGQRVFWSEASVVPGPLYVRLAGSVTKSLSSGVATFWGASANGDTAVYQEGDVLKKALIDGGGSVATSVVTDEAIGVVGMSTDARRIYFVSREDLDAVGAAASGQLNLYLQEEDGFKFVATLAAADLGVLSVVASEPSRRLVRVTPDGAHLVFLSQARLTGFDNRNQANGKASAEVFMFDAEGDTLRCVSCNPTGARPTARQLKTGLEGSLDTGVWAAAKFPAQQSQLYASRVVVDDGSRVFFESTDQLTAADTSLARDVYQWEELGAGSAEDSCDETDASFDPISGGCIDLISSGDIEADAEFLDASGSGDDVFFSSGASLIGADPGQIDIYDARVGGGLPEPPAAETDGPQCDLETDCQSVVPPPLLPHALGSHTQRSGNDSYKPPKPIKRCRKGTHRIKRRGKVRCVKNKSSKGRSGGKTSISRGGVS